MMISKRVGMTVSESVLWGLSGVLPLSPQLLKSRGDVKSVEEGGRSQTEFTDSYWKINYLFSYFPILWKPTSDNK